VKFDWDANKEAANVAKHGVDFVTACKAFDDPAHVIIADEKHNGMEPRFLCFGCVEGDGLTVRFVVRNGKIRIFGAGDWRKGRKIYEKENRE